MEIEQLEKKRTGPSSEKEALLLVCPAVKKRLSFKGNEKRVVGYNWVQ